MPAAFGVAGLGERRRLAGTTGRSPSTRYVPSQNIGRNPTSLELTELHYFPVILFTHTNSAHGHVGMGRSTTSHSSPTQTQRMALLALGGTATLVRRDRCVNLCIV